jgi:hypothetical protein
MSPQNPLASCSNFTAFVYAGKEHILVLIKKLVLKSIITVPE